jgi:hypothetical protein
MAKNIKVSTTEKFISSFSGSVPVGTIVETLGYSTEGDGGGASWKKTATTGTASQSPAQLVDGLLNDASGNQWALVGNSSTKSAALGTVISAQATTTIESALNAGSDVILPEGVLLADTTINASSKPSITMSGSTSTELNRDAASGNCVGFSSSDYASVKNLSIKLVNKDPTLTGHGLTIVDSDYASIENINFSGIDGDSFGCFIYNSDTSQPYAARIQNTKHSGTSLDIALPQGGAMLVASNFGIISQTWTDTIDRFPVELKGGATYNIIENSFIKDAVYGLYYGSQTSEHPSCNIANNLVTNGFDMAVYTGYGSHNIYNNLLLDAGANTGAVIGTNKVVGVKVINASDSLITNVLTKKDIGDFHTPIEISGTSSRNHISIAPRHTSAHAVTINSGSEKNSVEILGIGSFTSIFDTDVVTFNASSHSGVNGNPVYNNATGEYWGSVSAKFRWRLEDAEAVTLFSTDRWVFDSPIGLNSKAAITCSDSANAGFAVVTPTQRGELLYRPDFGGWQAGTTTNAYRFYPTSFRGLSNNVSSIGTSSALWTEVFAANGTINTSDERRKTELLDIDAAELAAAIEVKANIKKFKMLDSVDKKGDDARIHFGVGAQTVKAIFESHGLDAHDYSLFCYDEWDAEEEELDEEGNVSYAGREAGNAYGIRYGQLAMFILSTL